MDESNFIEWLESPLDDGTDKKQYERIAWLVKCNGGFEVTQWGIIRSNGIWQEGLNIGDALELIHYDGIFNGASLCGYNAFAAFEQYFNEYVERMESESAAK